MDLKKEGILRRVGLVNETCVVDSSHHYIGSMSLWFEEGKRLTVIIQELNALYPALLHGIGKVLDSNLRICGPCGLLRISCTALTACSTSGN